MERKTPVRITGLVASTSTASGITPVFQLNANRVVATASGVATAAVAIPVRTDNAAPCDLLLVSATTDIWIRFGSASVSATADANSILFPRGVIPVVVPLDSAGVPFTHFSVVQVTAGGSVQLEGVE
jgi:hypothetical protein